MGVRVLVCVQSVTMFLPSTGYPLLDAMLTSLLLYCISEVIQQCQKGLPNTFTYLMRALRIGGSSITVPRFEVLHCMFGEKHMPNIDYDALVWYMTTKMPLPSSGHMIAKTVCKTTKMDYTEEFVPAKMNVVEMTINGVTLGIYTDWSVIQLSDKMKTCNERIVMVSRGMRPGRVSELRSVLTHVRTLHSTHIKAITWKQRLFRLQRTNVGDSKGLSWCSELTHNNKTFDTVVLEEGIKDTLVADFRMFLRSEDWYRSMGLNYKRGYLLHGPPGTGKTSLVLALANEGKRDIYSMDLSKMHSDADLDQAFSLLPDMCVVMMEDVDAMGTVTHSRAQKADLQSQGCDNAAAATATTTANAAALVDAVLAATGVDAPGSHMSQGVTLSTLLNHMDGVGSNHGRVFVMTTNHPEVLDSALVRPGRVDLKVHLGMCSATQMRQFCKLYFDTDDAQTDAMIAGVPEYVLSPADVSCCFQHCRGMPEKATIMLRDLAECTVESGDAAAHTRTTE